MQTYKNFSPTGFDVCGLACQDQQDWLVAGGVNRDSLLLEEHNWEQICAQLEEIDPQGDDHEVHRFGHWACGWFELVLVRPGTAACAKSQELEDCLADYPILNEDKYCEKEWEAMVECWKNLSLKERVAACVEHDVHIMAARRANDIPQNNESLHEWLREMATCY